MSKQWPFFFVIMISLNSPLYAGGDDDIHVDPPPVVMGVKIASKILWGLNSFVQIYQSENNCQHLSAKLLGYANHILTLAEVIHHTVFAIKDFEQMKIYENANEAEKAALIYKTTTNIHLNKKEALRTLSIVYYSFSSLFFSISALAIWEAFQGPILTTFNCPPAVASTDQSFSKTQVFSFVGQIISDFLTTLGLGLQDTEQNKSEGKKLEVSGELIGASKTLLLVVQKIIKRFKGPKHLTSKQFHDRFSLLIEDPINRSILSTTMSSLLIVMGYYFHEGSLQVGDQLEEWQREHASFHRLDHEYKILSSIFGSEYLYADEHSIPEGNSVVVKNNSSVPYTICLEKKSLDTSSTNSMALNHIVYDRLCQCKERKTCLNIYDWLPPELRKKESISHGFSFLGPILQGKNIWSDLSIQKTAHTNTIFWNMTRQGWEHLKEFHEKKYQTSFRFQPQQKLESLLDQASQVLNHEEDNEKNEHPQDNLFQISTSEWISSLPNNSEKIKDTKDNSPINLTSEQLEQIDKLHEKNKIYEPTILPSGESVTFHQKRFMIHDIHEDHDGTIWEIIQHQYWKKAQILLSKEDYDLFLGINNEAP